MPGVKLSLLWIAAALAAIPAASCSKSQLTRFAPPGIIKYEEIASEKEQNPVIAARIERRQESGDAEYPLIARTPGPEDRPVGATKAERDALTDELTEARDELAAEIAAEREAVEEEQEEREDLVEKSSSISILPTRVSRPQKNEDALEEQDGKD